MRVRAGGDPPLPVADERCARRSHRRHDPARPSERRGDGDRSRRGLGGRSRTSRRRPRAPGPPARPRSLQRRDERRRDPRPGADRARRPRPPRARLRRAADERARLRPGAAAGADDRRPRRQRVGGRGARRRGADAAPPRGGRVRSMSACEACLAAVRAGRAAGARGDVWTVCRHEPAYPAQLADLDQVADLDDAPPVLFGCGRLAALARAERRGTVTIVGSRRATPYGIAVAPRLGRDLAAAGVVVVSGLAHGIDAAAHRGALAAGGTTIAVLAGGPDVVYPPRGARGYERIPAG